MTHKQLIELERVKSELSASILDREYAISKLEKTERDRDRATELSTRANNDSRTLQENNSRMEREHQEYTSDLLIKSKNQLKTVREEFETERIGLRSQIELLRQAKVDLQVICFLIYRLKLGSLLETEG